MKRSGILIDSLESRTLFSGGGLPTPGPFPEPFRGGGDLWLPALPTNASTTVQADYAKAVADRTAVQTDAAKIKTDLTALKTALDAAKTTLASQLAPLQAQLATDQAAEKTTLTADSAAIKLVYQQDLPAITLDFTNIAADLKAKNTTQLALDKAQLKTDQQKLQTDLAAPLAQYQKDDAAADAVIDADQKAIHDLLYGDAGVIAAQTQLTADQAVYVADLKTFLADRTQLLSDIKNGV